MVKAYLALGSNLGDRKLILRGAREALNVISGIRVTASSSLYETEPVGGPTGQGPYLNAVLQVATTLSAGELLGSCLEVEARFGRERRETWGPRTLDVDLLFYGDEIRSEPQLEIPHPRLHLRSFVLIPLLELAPDLVHPRLGLSVRCLAANLQPVRGIHRLSERW